MDHLFFVASLQTASELCLPDLPDAPTASRSSSPALASYHVLKNLCRFAPTTSEPSLSRSSRCTYCKPLELTGSRVLSRPQESLPLRSKPPARLRFPDLCQCTYSKPLGQSEYAVTANWQTARRGFHRPQPVLPIAIRSQSASCHHCFGQALRDAG